MSEQTTPPHTDEMNDAVLRSIAEDIAEGLCWACGCEDGAAHSPYCPEQEAWVDAEDQADG